MPRPTRCGARCAAEAAGREQIIAAKAQEEAMKHVLPFKQKQIEQRQLEAEADKVTRIKGAEGDAQARRIEATGEADARQQARRRRGLSHGHASAASTPSRWRAKASSSAAIRC